LQGKGKAGGERDGAAGQKSWTEGSALRVRSLGWGNVATDGQAKAKQTYFW